MNIICAWLPPEGTWGSGSVSAHSWACTKFWESLASLRRVTWARHGGWSLGHREPEHGCGHLGGPPGSSCPRLCENQLVPVQLWA